jgi:peptide/nickel transport system substrate-binding protein
MRFLKASYLLTAACLLLAACRSTTTTPTTPAPVIPTSTVSAAPPAPTATATAVPPKTLVICTQNEPQTLYVYGGSSRSMWSVLEAIYDGPFDTRAFSTQPVILQKIPSLADDDAQMRPVEVRAGDPVVDVDGNLTALQAGTKVMPSGCSSPGCAAAWDGSSALSMGSRSPRTIQCSRIRWRRIPPPRPRNT